jgi:hypothetical protein
MSNRAKSRARRAGIGAAVIAGLGLVALLPRHAAAHFYLEEPPSWSEQDTLGDPQKFGPCGGTVVETGAVTAYQTGQTITITIRETVYHPGHFRVALAVDDRSELPAPPPVTEGETDCGSVPIMDPPVFPVLADGVLAHTSRLSGDQSFEVTLPDGVTCDHCTLQIIQWMSDHGAPCFYYHCADISISDVVVDSGTTESDGAISGTDASSPRTDGAVARADGSTSIDGGAGARVDGGGSAPTPSASCGCAAPGRASGPSAPAAIALVALVAPLLVFGRRRLRRDR